MNSIRSPQVTKNITRLFCEVNFELYESKDIYDLTKDQIHYLIDVKKNKESDQINLIDGRSGEFRCQIIQFSKKRLG